MVPGERTEGGSGIVLRDSDAAWDHRWVKRLDRAYRAYLRGHELATAATSESELWDSICTVCVEELGYRLAWVGLKEDEGHRVVPVAQAGFEDGYLDSIEVTWSDDQLGHGPTGTAVRTGRTRVARDIATDRDFEPWRADALKRGYASSAAIPLMHGSKAVGALNLYAPEPKAFADRELAFLESLAADLMLCVLQLRNAQKFEAMSEALERAARAETANSVMAAVTHDLNNLLLVASLAVELVRSEPDAPEAKENLDDAAHALESASALMRQVMALSRIERDENGDAEADRVIAALQRLLTRLAAECTLEVHLQAPRARVAIAPLALERIVLNLVLNATQALPGGGHIDVSTGTRHVAAEGLVVRGNNLAEGEYLVLTVSDDGRGVPPEALPHVFEPYFTTREEDGTGLGLSTIDTLAREAGGGADVESSEGRGSRFSIWLPLVTGA